MKVSELDYAITFGSAEGQRVLKDLMKRYYNRISFVPDPYETAKREGERSTVHHILRTIRGCKNKGLVENIEEALDE